MLTYSKQIRMRGIWDSIKMMYHLIVIDNKKEAEYHFTEKHRLNMKFMYENIILPSDIPVPVKISSSAYKVWVLWWQGENGMPPVVKASIASLRKATDKEVVLITQDNINSFVDIPEYIHQKIQKKKISLAALSDYIRVSLLCRYGGLWVDSTILVSERIPDEVYQAELFTIRDKANGNRYVAAGKWNGQFLGTCSCNTRVFYIMKYIFEQYWRKYNVLIDYLFIDYSFEYIYQKDKECRELFNSLPYSNGNMHVLRTMMNEPFNESLFRSLHSDGTFLFKLTYKDKLCERANGEPTFYSYVINKYK